MAIGPRGEIRGSEEEAGNRKRWHTGSEERDEYLRGRKKTRNWEEPIKDNDGRVWLDGDKRYPGGRCEGGGGTEGGC